MYKYSKLLTIVLGILGLFLYSFFGWRSLDANISADDAGFIFGITGGSPVTWFHSMLAYVPGRNLHIFWQAILFNVTGGSMGDLRNYHLFQAIFFGVVGLLVLLVLKRGGTSRLISLYCGLLALVFPLFSSILLWANSLPQHIISSLLFLVGVYLVLPREETSSDRKLILNAGLAWLALTLSMFTYDQSAAATGVLTLVLIAKSVFKSKAQWIPVRTSFFLTTILGFSLVAYIYVFFLGRGTGDNLTFGSKTLGRLFENLMIPTKVMSKFSGGSASGRSYFHFEPYVILWILFVLISLAILILARVLLSNDVMPAKVGVKSIALSGLFLVLAFAAYIPSAIWYVAPRHLYFPALLSFISAGFLIQYITLRIPVKSPIRAFSGLIALFIFLGSAFGFNGQLDTWMDRDSYRENFYRALEPALVSQEMDCVVVSRVLNNSDTYLYSESLNLAMGYYNGASIGESKDCASVPAEREDHVFSCTESNRENWAELVSYSFDQSSKNFKFNFKEVCLPS